MSITLISGESSLYLGESTGSNYVRLTNTEGISSVVAIVFGLLDVPTFGIRK